MYREAKEPTKQPSTSCSSPFYQASDNRCPKKPDECDNNHHSQVQTIAGSRRLYSYPHNEKSQQKIRRHDSIS